MVARTTVLIGAALFACKSEGKSSDAPTKQPDAAPVVIADASVKAAIDAAPASIEPLEIAVADQCKDPCLLLARYRFAAISEGAYCEVCKEVKTRACELEWPPIEDQPSCDDWDVWRNCLLAAHGYRFRRAKTRAQYRRKRWYKTRRRVRADKLGGVARANLDYLKTRASACRKALAAQAGRTIAKLRGDFNGDRRKSVAVVTDSAVRLGRRKVEHGLVPTDDMAAIEATLIDIDSSDRAVEILVALHPGEAAASRYVVVYVSGTTKRRRGRPGVLKASEVIESFGAVEPNGDGSLEIREQNCGQTRELSIGYRSGELVVTKDQTDGERDPNQCE